MFIYSTKNHLNYERTMKQMARPIPEVSKSLNSQCFHFHASAPVKSYGRRC